MNSSQSQNPISPETLLILGVPFHNLTFDEAIAWALDQIKTGNPGYIATANLDFLMQARKDPELRRILIDADLVIADGLPVVGLSRILGPRLKGRVTGSDIVPLMAKPLANQKISLFALGGAPGVAEKATQKLKQKAPELKISGCYSPPKATLLEMDNSKILTILEKADPDLLLVALGAPKQEKWIKMQLQKWQIPLSIGIGGTLDFLAGSQKRAPKGFQALGLEWLWRLLAHPKRLTKRYFSNIGFLFWSTLKLAYIKTFLGRVPKSIISPDPKQIQELGGKLYRYEEIKIDLENKDPTLNKVSPIIDLQRISWLDSAELGLLLELSKACRDRGNRLYLINTAPRIKSFLEECQLHHYWKIKTSPKELLDDLLQNKRNSHEDLQSFSGDEGLVLILPRELTATQPGQFDQKLAKIWSEKVTNTSRVSLDAQFLEYMDSSGLAAVLDIHERAKRENIQLLWRNFHGQALQVLKTSLQYRTLHSLE